MERSKILVVDDEKLVRRMIARVLESEGMSIVEASNGLDAVQMAKAQPFDLIILDIIMEGIDGFQVIHQLRSEGMLTPVFILSGRQADNDKVFALGIGADDYITKPFSPSVLCAKVKACLRRMSLSAPSSSGVLSAGPFCYFSDEMRLLKKRHRSPSFQQGELPDEVFPHQPEQGADQRADLPQHLGRQCGRRQHHYGTYPPPAHEN